MLSVIPVFISLLSMAAIPQPEPVPSSLTKNMWYQKQKYNAWGTLGNNVSCYICAAPWPILDVVPIPYRTDECHKTPEPTKPPIMETQTATLCAVSVMTALSQFKRWHKPDELEHFFTYTVDIQVYTLTVAPNTATSQTHRGMLNAWWHDKCPNSEAVTYRAH